MRFLTKEIHYERKVIGHISLLLERTKCQVAKMCGAHGMSHKFRAIVQPGMYFQNMFTFITSDV